MTITQKHLETWNLLLKNEKMLVKDKLLYVSESINLQYFLHFLSQEVHYSLTPFSVKVSQKHSWSAKNSWGGSNVEG